MTNSNDNIYYGVNPMPTKETWQEYMEDEIGGLPALRYLESTIHIVQKLENITTLQSFDEMKNELSNLYEERLAFVKHALRHLP